MNSGRKFLSVTALALSPTFLLSAYSTENVEVANAARPMQDSSTADASASLSEGEIKKVDKDAGKITIKHGELKNLGMPPMTMVFRAKDPTMFDLVTPGDKVSFVADKVDEQFTVTRLEVKK